MRPITTTSVCLALSFATVAAPARAAVETWPTCDAPQPLTPQRTGSTANAYQLAAAWNGKDFALLFLSGGGQLLFERFYADGTPVTAPIVVAYGARSAAVGIAWNGNGYGIAWVTTANNGTPAVYFTRLDRNGNSVGLAVQASYYNASPQFAASTAPGLVAWNGSGYAVVWHDARSGTADVYATTLDVGGNVVAHDLAITSATGDQTNAAVAWSRASGRWVIVWQDRRSGTHWELYAEQITHGGGLGSNNLAFTGAADSTTPAIADSGGSLGLAWSDTRDGNPEIYFGQLSPFAYPAGAAVRLTNESGYSLMPVLLWTGAEYGVFWRDTAFNYDIWFQRVSAGGSAVGSKVQVTHGAYLDYLTAAFGAHGYMAACDINTGAPLQLQPWGCAYPAAPLCPEAPDAYGITGTTATISWLPVESADADLAYYQVYRNNAIVGVTDDTVFNDGGLSPNVTYQYNIRAVNAADLSSQGCTNSQIYVRTSSALSLTVGRTADDVDLGWNDVGQNTYRVMRGTSPQAMTEIRRTSATSATDANAAVGSVCYFYSIDVPQS